MDKSLNKTTVEKATATCSIEQDTTNCSTLPTSKRPHQLYWTPSLLSENETYSTVVFKYNYPMTRYSASHSSVETLKKQQHDKNSNKPSKTNIEDEDDIPNLRSFFEMENSKESLHQAESNSTDNRQSMKNSSFKKSTASSNKTQMMHNVEVEICNLPSLQNATAEPVLKETADYFYRSDNNISETQTDDVQQQCIPNDLQIESENNKRDTTTTGTQVNNTQVNNNKKSLRKKLPATKTTQTSPKSSTPPPKEKKTHKIDKLRMSELHRHRVEVELKRIELINLKLERQREEIRMEKVLYEKELEIKSFKLFKLYNNSKA